MCDFTDIPSCILLSVLSGAWATRFIQFLHKYLYCQQSVIIHGNYR